MLEDDVELIFTNSRPVDVSDAKGINCIGCNLTLEYFNDKESFTKEISTIRNNFELEFKLINIFIKYSFCITFIFFKI